MKRYDRPMMDVQMFVANEYVAACGDSGTVYKFECDADGGTLYYYPQYRVVSGEAFSPEVAKQKSRDRLGSFDPCPASHEAESTNSFYWGFIDYDKDQAHDHDTETVIVWRGPWGINGHATKNLDMDSWETAKS